MATEKPNVLIRDNGLFVSLAEMFGRAGYNTRYFAPWESAYPRSNLRHIGSGLEGVERIDKFSRSIDWATHIIFTDVYSGDIQAFLRDSYHKNVWGAGEGEDLELVRDDTKAYMEEQGADIGPWSQIDGMDDLEAYLRRHKDVYIKTNGVRGDFETQHHRDWKRTEHEWFGKTKHRLGPLADDYPFVVEKSIDGVEIALDIYSVDGRFPSKGLIGLEIKGKGYVSHFTSRKFWPKPLVDLYEKFVPEFERTRYRQLFAAEARINGKGKAYLLDPCCRSGSPVVELEQLMYTNLPEIMVEGAEGRLIDPEIVEEDGEAQRWGAELLLTSPDVQNEWVPVWFPKEIAPYVKLHNVLVRKGVHWIVPCPGSENMSIGAVVAVGRSMKEAMQRCVEYADQIEAPNLQYFPEAFEQADKELDKFAAMGLKM